MFKYDHTYSTMQQSAASVEVVLSCKKCRVSVNLTDDEHKFIEELSIQLDVSQSWVIRKAIQEYLSKASLNLQFDSKKVDKECL
ncbi:ribbon-helix-helix protein, CopG family [Vibrio parahaemolyticus]|nr:ribbon-helix-helix protein, CopG family [Vibrio parahaemolyticus]